MLASTATRLASAPRPVPRMTATSGTRSNRPRTTSAARSTCSSVGGPSSISWRSLPSVPAADTATLLLHQRVQPRGRGVRGPLRLFGPRCRRGSTHGGLRHGRGFRRFDFHELALDHRPELRQVRTPRAYQALDLILEAAGFGTDGLEVALDLCSRLAHHELRLAIRLFTNLRPKLLRRDERVVERLVALAERAKLLHGPLRFLLELLIRAAEPLHFGRDLVAELVDPRLVVAAQRRAEIVPADVDRREMKGFVTHACRAPNRTVPSLTIVAPSSTAIS